MKETQNLSISFFRDCKYIKRNIFNGKCIEDSGRSRLGGKRVLGCDNKFDSLFVQKGYNLGGTCL